ncbi:FAD dependent oxidoreductase [Sphaerosporella brunnea]|uniref:FAD dependent oxidoreductase n=1 Tax=Sphaerosporella brunnea TaxID=1250544 RepID=A0A5J5F942_9PEZI|nr:FAD dependent oxidoreductase [Sphaerosporella brunnea]
MTEPPTADPGLPRPASTHSFWHAPPSAFLHAHRTTASLPSSVSTVIIGSGIAGTMLFHNLHKLGLSDSTLMLEARNTCWGATGRNGGHCKPMLYQSGEFVDMCSVFGVDEALERIRFEALNLQLVKDYIERENVNCEWVETSSADVFYEAAPFELAKLNIEALQRLAPELAARLRVVENRRELRESLRTPTAVGAVVFTAGKLSPYKLVSHILEKAVKDQGLNLQTTTPACSVSRAGDKWAVETPRGIVTADRVIFATNAHTAHLLPVFRGWIYPVRAQMSALIPPKSLKDRPLTHSYGLVKHDRKTACYLIQRPLDEDGGGGELMLGGCREFEENQGIGMQDGAINLNVAYGLRTSIPGYFADETGYEGEDAGEEHSRELRKSFIEKFQCKARMEWSGTMGFSKDKRPFVGRVPAVGEGDAEKLRINRMDDTKGLWMLAGFEGHGMAFTSGSALALATMIEADVKGTGSHDLSLYEWFPRTFEATPERLGLVDVENWEEVPQEDGWELIDKEG